MHRLQRLAPGLRRWSAPHPEWNPQQDEAGDGWPEQVGSLLYDTPELRLFIDPLLPEEGTPEATELWAELQTQLEGRSVAVIVVNLFHARSAGRVAEHFGGAPVWGPADAVAHLAKNGCRVTHPYRGGDALPGGLQAFDVQGLWPGEQVLFLPKARALVFADAVLGEERGTARLPPRRWSPEPEHSHERLRASLRPLLALDVDLLLVSHGEPLLRGGRQTLASLL